MKSGNLPEKFEKDTTDVLAETLQNLTEGLTGIASSSRKELALSIGYLFQRMRGGQFLAVALEEWKKYQEKGRINDDYQFTEQHKVCLQDLFDFLENDCPDELRFSVLKKIFIVAATEEMSDRDSLIPQQYMKIARTLNDGEIVIMNACHKISKQDESEWPQDWVTKIASETGLKHNELVEMHESSLMEKKLLTKRRFTDGSGFIFKQHYRLTELGYRFCEFIAKYEE